MSHRQNVLLGLSRDPPDCGLSSPPVSALVPVVPVLVLGVRLELPEPALREALSHLRLTMEARASLAGYAEGVAIVLRALARNGQIAFLAERQAHG